MYLLLTNQQVFQIEMTRNKALWAHNSLSLTHRLNNEFTNKAMDRYLDNK
jgi:hypothetical protein